MQDNYEEDLSEKEKAIVREMCNVRTPPSNSWGSFKNPNVIKGCLLLEVWRNRDLLHVRHKGRVEALLITVLGDLNALFTAQSSLCSVDSSHFDAFLAVE